MLLNPSYRDEGGRDIWEGTNAARMQPKRAKSPRLSEEKQGGAVTIKTKGLLDG